MADWIVGETAGTVSTIRVKYKRSRAWEQWALVTSDRHIDNTKSDHAMQKRHLDQAKERGAFILDHGDLFCAMQGKSDRRSSKGSLRDENKTSDYLGSMVRSTYNFLAPYQENFALISPGNHETSVLKNNELDLTRALVDKMRDNWSQVVKGGYRGWLRIMFKSGNERSSLNLHYMHGAGGGGPVTRGVINTNRRAVYLPDADIVVGGHIHEAWMLEITRARISDGGKEYPDTQLHICLPTYKEEFFNTGDGWHHETEKGPKPLGAWWLRFFYDGSRVRFEAMRAR